MQRSEMFDAVKQMNDAFGNPEGNPHLLEPNPANVELAEVQWQRVQKQCENIGGSLTEGRIRGEVAELLQALADRDPVAVRDALCDVMVFALGAYHIAGFDADLDMVTVIAANMTRMCSTEQQLADTVKAWADRGITQVYASGEFPMLCLKSAADQIDSTGDNAPRGKFLKSVGHRKPVFAPAGITVDTPTDAVPLEQHRRFMRQQVLDRHNGPPGGALGRRKGDQE